MVWYDNRKKLAKEFEESCIGLHAPHSPFNVISFLEGIGRLKDEEDVKVCEITANIPLDRLEAICQAEREGRLQIMSCVGCKYNDEISLEEHNANCMRCIRNRIPIDKFTRAEAEAAQKGMGV